MNKIKIRRIKNIRRIKKMNHQKTDKQIETSRRRGWLRMIINNPMKDPMCVKKLKEKMKGRITSPNNLFKKGNIYGSIMTEDKKKSAQRNAYFLGIKNRGRKSIYKGITENNPHTKRISKEDREKIIIDKSNGLSPINIRKKYNISKGTYYRIIKEYKLCKEVVKNENKISNLIIVNA